MPQATERTRTKTGESAEAQILTWSGTEGTADAERGVINIKMDTHRRSDLSPMVRSLIKVTFAPGRSNKVVSWEVLPPRPLQVIPSPTPKLEPEVVAARPPVVAGPPSKPQMATRVDSAGSFIATLKQEPYGKRVFRAHGVVDGLERVCVVSKRFSHGWLSEGLWLCVLTNQGVPELDLVCAAIRRVETNPTRDKRFAAIHQHFFKGCYISIHKETGSEHWLVQGALQNVQSTGGVLRLEIKDAEPIALHTHGEVPGGQFSLEEDPTDPWVGTFDGAENYLLKNGEVSICLRKN